MTRFLESALGAFVGSGVGVVAAIGIGLQLALRGIERSGLGSMVGLQPKKGRR